MPRRLDTVIYNKPSEFEGPLVSPRSISLLDKGEGSVREDFWEALVVYVMVVHIYNPVKFDGYGAPLSVVLGA